MNSVSSAVHWGGPGPAPAARRPGGGPGAAPPQGTDELTLFTSPLLVDEGRLSEGAAELKATLEDEPFAEVHPDDAAKHGLVDGARVRVRTRAGGAVVTVRVTEHVAPGSVFVPFNQAGLAANTLLSGRFTAAVELETVAAELEPAAAGSGW